MTVLRLGVHEGVGKVFPPDRLLDALSPPAGVEVTVVAADRIDTCDALIVHSYEPEFLDAGLEWIQTISSGVDTFPLEAVSDRGIALSSCRGIHGDSIGETVMGYLLMFSRLLHRYRWSQYEKRWDRPAWDEPTLLAGTAACVVGVGTIGSSIAAKASALGVSVTGVNRSGDAVAGVEEVVSIASLHEVLEAVEFVVLSLPLTDATRGLFGPAEFDRMRSDAYLINVARGPIVESDALVAAIENDEIAGAALDVFDQRPLPRSAPFWDMEEVIVTPHASGLMRDYYRRVAAIANENMDRFVSDEPLRNQVI